MNHYRIKFTHNGQLYFGTVDNCSQEAKVAASENHCIVEDAVLPARYNIPESEITDIPLSVDNILSGDEYDKYVKVAFDKAQAISNELPDKGVHVGSLFSLSVADGLAWYVVTKVNKKSCRIEWRGFCADRWKERYFGIGGTFPITEVCRYVEGAKLMDKMFARKTG